jgi:hypothetical protein
MANVDNLIEAQKTARQMLHLHGADALRVALVEAQIADDFDDSVAAEIWRDVARAIRQIKDASNAVTLKTPLSPRTRVTAPTPQPRQAFRPFRRAATPPLTVPKGPGI